MPSTQEHFVETMSAVCSDNPMLSKKQIVKEVAYTWSQKLTRFPWNWGWTPGKLSFNMANFVSHGITIITTIHKHPAIQVS